MLFASVGAQHGAPCYQQNSLRPASNSVRFKHRRCTTVQPRSSKPVQVMVIKNTSTAGASSKSSRSSSSNSKYFFHDREGESKALEDHCSSQPTAISVILGPRSAGKTALLKEYMRDRGLTDSRCLIDARVTPISTPSELARVLVQAAVPKVGQKLFPDVKGLSELAKKLTPVLSAAQNRLKLPNGLEITVNGKAIAGVLQAFAGNTEEMPPLAEVTEAYIALLDAWDEASAVGLETDASPPVIILDEANVLMRWSAQYQEERRTLLDFFVAISKVQGRSHVLLATSEYSFQTWLTAEIGGGAPFFNTFVVGEFPEAEARGFLNKCLQQSVQSEVSDDDWKTVYQACGGNAGALKGAAHFYHTLGSWEKALTQLAKDVWITMKPGYRPAPDAGYTATDYATAVKDILKSDYKAVQDVDLEAKLGKQSLDAMVQANLLALRPYSSWAADIDVEAFGPDQLFTVVTAPSTLHLYLMERQRDLLLEPLDDEQVPAQGNADSSTSPGRPGSPMSDALKAVVDDIKAVQGEIAGFEGQIQEISKEISAIRKAKGEGWQDEMARLQQDKQQLVEEQRRLRNERQVLQEQKLLLIKREE